MSLLDSEKFAEIVSDEAWLSIDDIAERCDAEGFWSDEWLAGALERAKKYELRRLLRAVEGDDGFPMYASITVTDEEGSETRLYKQEALFDVEDYVVVIKYHEKVAAHHLDRARTYLDRGVNRYGNQLRFKLGQGAA